MFDEKLNNYKYEKYSLIKTQRYRKTKNILNKNNHARINTYDIFDEIIFDKMDGFSPVCLYMVKTDFDTCFGFLFGPRHYPEIGSWHTTG